MCGAPKEEEDAVICLQYNWGTIVYNYNWSKKVLTADSLKAVLILCGGLVLKAVPRGERVLRALGLALTIVTSCRLISCLPLESRLCWCNLAPWLQLRSLLLLVACLLLLNSSALQRRLLSSALAQAIALPLPRAKEMRSQGSPPPLPRLALWSETPLTSEWQCKLFSFSFQFFILLCFYFIPDYTSVLLNFEDVFQKVSFHYLTEFQLNLPELYY
jgi:hypothetical protein